MIAGPCSVESPEQVMRIAKEVAACGATALRGGVFKPRTNPYAFQGHGYEALEWLVAASREVKLPIVTEVMAVDQVKPVAEKFRDKYGVKDVKKYYSKLDAAVLAHLP